MSLFWKWNLNWFLPIITVQDVHLLTSILLPCMLTAILCNLMYTFMDSHMYNLLNILSLSFSLLQSHSLLCCICLIFGFTPNLSYCCLCIKTCWKLGIHCLYLNQHVTILEMKYELVSSDYHTSNSVSLFLEMKSELVFDFPWLFHLN